MQRIYAGCVSVLLFFGMVSAGAQASPAAAPDNETCLACHNNPALQPVTAIGEGRSLLISQADYGRSVHRSMACLECHSGKSGLESFKQVPHAFEDGAGGTGDGDCMRCHPSVFRDIDGRFKKSHHFQKLGSKISCRDCHDPHTMIQADLLRTTGTFDIDVQNRTCIECHTNLVGYRELSGRGIETQNFSHNFLPFKETHFTKVRCVRCHAAEEASDFHIILPRAQSLTDCTACHSDRAPAALAGSLPLASETAGVFLGKGLFDDTSLIQRLAEVPVPAAENEPSHQPANEAGFINQGRFTDSYLVGGTRNTETDRRVFLVLACVLAAVAIHGMLRWIAKKKSTAIAPRGGHAEGVYGRSVRLTHWINAVCVAALMATGVSMHWGGSRGMLPFDFSVGLHHVAAYLLVFNYVVFVVSGLVTGSARSYLPSTENAGARLWAQIRFYLYGIFRGDAHPFRATRTHRFNSLQTAIYLPLMFIALPLMIVSGLFMLVPGLTPETVFGVPGRWFAATFHYLLAMLFVAFLITHVYLCTTGEKPGTFFKAMLFGGKKGC